MKTAAITDDGKTISQHFGRAPYYMVISIEEGSVVGMELRDKWGIPILPTNPMPKRHTDPGTVRMPIRITSI